MFIIVVFSKAGLIHWAINTIFEGLENLINSLLKYFETPILIGDTEFYWNCKSC